MNLQNGPPESLLSWISLLPAEWQRYARAQATALWHNAFAAGLASALEPPQARATTSSVAPSDSSGRLPRPRRRMLLVRGEPEQLIEAAFRRIFPKTASVGQIIEEIQHTTGKRVLHGPSRSSESHAKTRAGAGGQYRCVSLCRRKIRSGTIRRERCRSYSWGWLSAGSGFPSSAPGVQFPPPPTSSRHRAPVWSSPFVDVSNSNPGLAEKEMKLLPSC